MKHKLAYGLREPKLQNDSTFHHPRSPQRSMLYESNTHIQDVAFRQTYNFHKERDFNQVKRIPENSERFRHTMDQQICQRIGTLNFGGENQKNGKFNQLLRQTMDPSVRSRRKQVGEDESPFAKEVYIKSGKGIETELRNSDDQSNRPSMIRVKSAGHLKPFSNHTTTKHLVQRLERNKKLVEQLKKSNRNYLKNVNHNKSPTYIDLDQQNQSQKLEKKQRIGKSSQQEVHNKNLEHCRSADRKFQSETVISTQPSLATHRRKRKGSPVTKHQMIDQFEEGKRLGQGKFGVVNCARHKPTGALFALKKIQKAVIKSNMMVDQTALQIRIQSCLTHQNILAMYGFFQDKHHLYIVLQYMTGGTLYQKLKDQTKLSERQTANVIKQVAQAIDYMHDRGIVHRDIKPQNIVISDDMYKVCDFGWAAMCDQRRKTYCGTFDYVSPEILAGSEYDMSVDLWCLGVLTFELLTGKAPFYHVSRKETVKRILNVENHQLEFPEDMSTLAQDFIDRLVRKNPKERMKASEVCSHPFITQIDSDL